MSQQGMSQHSLDVSSKNTLAKRLYENQGLVADRENIKNVVMILHLNKVTNHHDREEGL